MFYLLSIPGLLRTLLIIVGVFVVIRFIGQIMTAKRQQAEADAQKRYNDQLDKEKRFKEKHKGKTRILKRGSQDGNVQDVDFEEID